MGRQSQCNTAVQSPDVSRTIDRGWRHLRPAGPAVTHNEWAPRLGVLEQVFVTPSNHRVHHQSGTGAVTRNYGNILIIWDRLFGTCQAEGDVRILNFGVDGRSSTRVADMAFGEWRRIFQDLRKMPPRGFLRKRLARPAIVSGPTNPC
ncbi:MAG TPA: sterol desaturase family protein [Rhizomicrobium sp.]|jgi:hypothetical protein